MWSNQWRSHRKIAAELFRRALNHLTPPNDSQYEKVLLQSHKNEMNEAVTKDFEENKVDNLCLVGTHGDRRNDSGVVSQNRVDMVHTNTSDANSEISEGKAFKAKGLAFKALITPVVEADHCWGGCSSRLFHESGCSSNPSSDAIHDISSIRPTKVQNQCQKRIPSSGNTQFDEEFFNSLKSEAGLNALLLSLSQNDPGTPVELSSLLTQSISSSFMRLFFGADLLSKHMSSVEAYMKQYQVTYSAVARCSRVASLPECLLQLPGDPFGWKEFDKSLRELDKRFEDLVVLKRVSLCL